jgi:phosphoglycerate dehydrogenase-like enzyme
MYDRSGMDQMKAAGHDVVVVDSSSLADLRPALAEADALWVRYPEKATADVLAAGPRLAIVSSSGFGTDNVDIPAATAAGILVVNQRGLGRIPVPEHAIMMLLACFRQLVANDAATREGSVWNRRSDLELYELEGKTIALLGLGFIGSELARKLRVAFNCRVLAYDPYVDARLVALSGAELFESLEAMLPLCDAFVLCPELTPETRKIISRRELALLRRGAYVVNTSRGGVLDLDAIDEALRSGHLAGAGIDVYDPEPPLGHPILTNPRATLSSHTAGITREATARMTASAVEQILAALTGTMPRYPMNEDAWEGVRSRRPRAPVSV